MARESFFGLRELFWPGRAVLAQESLPLRALENLPWKFLFSQRGHTGVTYVTFELNTALAWSLGEHAMESFGELAVYFCALIFTTRSHRCNLFYAFKYKEPQYC